MTTAEDLSQAKELVRQLEKKKKAENAKSTLTTVQKEKMHHYLHINLQYQDN